MQTDTWSRHDTNEEHTRSSRSVRADNQIYLIMKESQLPCHLITALDLQVSSLLVSYCTTALRAVQLKHWVNLSHHALLCT